VWRTTCNTGACIERDGTPPAFELQKVHAAEYMSWANRKKQPESNHSQAQHAEAKAAPLL